MKIVSLLPSATEIICALGLREHLVGVTHECNYPESVIGLPVVTETLIAHGLRSRDIDAQVRQHLQTSQALYSLKMDVLESLAPDIIVTQALCEVCAVSEQEVQDAVCSLSGNPQVINLEPMCLQDVFDTMLLVGEATDCLDHSKHIVQQLQDRVTTVRQRSAEIEQPSRKTVSFLEWIDPLFNAGHWTPELIEYAGGIDSLGHKFKPSVTIEWETVQQADSAVLFIACCGFDQARALQDMPILTHKPGWDSLQSVKKHQVYVANGNAYFSSPGPRLVDSLELLAHTLYPDIHVAADHFSKPVVYCA